MDTRQGRPPALSSQQLQSAREAATRARRHRAEVKTALKQGHSSLAEVVALADVDDVIAHIKVVDLLKSMPRVGDMKAQRIMARLEIAPSRRIRGLGPNQLTGLLAEFG